MSKATCSNTECDAPSRARGLCRRHYARWYNSPEGREAPKTMGRPRLEPVECAHPGCTKPARTLGRCWTHANRVRRYGRIAKITVEEKFFGRVTEADGGCWIYGPTKQSGYGQFMVGRKQWMAHRWAYTFMVGEIPPGLTLDHLCHVTACVNPAHLDPVPIAVNVARANRRRARLRAA